MVDVAKRDEWSNPHRYSSAADIDNDGFDEILMAGERF
jgi:hypothetical protein